MTDHFDAVRTQHVEKSLGIADGGDGVHGAAREFVQCHGGTADHAQGALRLEAHAESSIEQRPSSVHDDGIRRRQPFEHRRLDGTAQPQVADRIEAAGADLFDFLAPILGEAIDLAQAKAKSVHGQNVSGH